MEAILPDEKGRLDLSDFIKDNISEKQILICSIEICQAMEFIN